jgi:hypothetical protein
VAEPRGLDGCRLVADKLMGRVSHISGYRVPDEQAKSQKTLDNWRARWAAEHPDLPEDFHSQRGTLFHSACEHRLITGQDPTELHPWIEPFYPQARGILAQYGTIYWAEKPIDLSLPWPDLEFQADNGDRRWHVWHSKGYCGTPDLVARWRGKTCLSDWKTSEKLYVPTKPRFSRSNSKDPAAEAMRKERINGWYKYVRTCRQLAAYLIALEERLGMEGWIDVATINVVTPDKGVQQLAIYRNELLGSPWQEFCNNLEQWQTEHKLAA